jgi:hypothetical protein
MVLIFALNGKPSSPNTAKRKQQTNRLPILTVNRRDTPPETQSKPPAKPVAPRLQGDNAGSPTRALN